MTTRAPAVLKTNMEIFLGNMDHTFSGGGSIGTGHQKIIFISPQELGILIPTQNIVAFADGTVDLVFHNQKQNNNTCAAPQQGWVEVQPLPSPGPTTIPQHGYLVLSILSSWLWQNCFFIVFFSLLIALRLRSLGLAASGRGVVSAAH